MVRRKLIAVKKLRHEKSVMASGGEVVGSREKELDGGGDGWCEV